MIVQTSTPRTKVSSYGSNWFIMDDIWKPPMLYKVLPYDEDGDIVVEFGGVSFDQERYGSVEAARKAFDAAVKVDNDMCFPPVRAEIVKILHSGTIERKETTISWS